MTPTPKPSKSTPAAAAVLANSSLPPVLPTPSQSTSVTSRQTRQRLERQLAEHEKLLQESSSGIGKNVLAGQIGQIKDRLRDLDQQQHQQRRDDPLERLRSLEREYRSNNSSSSTSSRTLDPVPSSSATDLLPLPPAPTSSATPTKRRSKVPSADRRNTDIEFATEIGQGLLIEVRKMQALLQQKEEQLSQLDIQKTDLERAVEAMAKQLRQREEIHEKLKEETWDLEVAKQELTISVTELQQNLQKSVGEQGRVLRQMNNLKAEMEKMRDREEKLSQQLEVTKTRHEHDMGVMRRHGAQLQREKADQKKQIDALTSELAIAKAQSRIQKKSHVDLDHQYQQQAQLLLAGEIAASADPADSTDSNTEPAHDASTSDHPPGSPKHKALEVETLKSSLAHAHRMVSNLRGNLHREKQEKFELKKLLAESQEAIEQMQNEDMWVDRPGSLQQQQQPHRPSSTKAQKQKRHKASGKHGRKVKGGVSRAGRSASASASNKEEGDSTEYYDDEDDVPEESEYSSGGDDDLDEDEAMMPPPAMVGLSLADQLKTATRMVSAATQTEHNNPGEMAVATRTTGEEVGVQTDAEAPVTVVAQGKEFSTQTDVLPVAKTEEVGIQTDVTEMEMEMEEHAPKAKEIDTQSEAILTPSLQDHYTQTEDNLLVTQSQANLSQQPVAVGRPTNMRTDILEKATAATWGPVNPAASATAESTGMGAQVDSTLTLSAIVKGDTVSTQTVALAAEEGSTQTDPAIMGAEITTQTDAIPDPAVAAKDFSTQTTVVQSEETSTQTEEQKRFSAQALATRPFTVVVGDPFSTEGTTTAGERSEGEALVSPPLALTSHQIQQAPTDRHRANTPMLTSAVTPHHEVAPAYSNRALSDGPMFMTAQAVPQQHHAVTALADATQISLHNAPTMTILPTSSRREATCWSMTSMAADGQGNVAHEQQQQLPAATAGFELPTIPIVSITGFDSRPQSMASTAAADEQDIFAQQPMAMTEFNLPTIPIVSVTGFESCPQSMATVGPVTSLPVGSARSAPEETAGAQESVEMITRAEANAMVAAAVQAAVKPYLDINRAKESDDGEKHFPQRPLNRPPSVLLSKATQRLTSMHGGSNGEEVSEFGTAYVSTQSMNYPTSQQQPRHSHHHQRRDSDSSASTAHTADHRRPSFSSMQVNEAAQTASQHGISDPGAIALITQTMIGDWLWKYTRKAVGGGISERRHKRFFWIHPYTRTLYWSAHAPGVDGKESKAKSALIESITTIPEHTPLGAAHVSMLVQTPGRQLRITAPDMSHHEVWYNSLSYLVERADASAGDQDSKKSSSSVDPQYITPSLSTNSILKKPSFPRLRPARSVSSFAGSINSTTTTGSSNSRRTQHRRHQTIHNDDDDDEDLEDVRVCCNGKHHVSKLEKDQHHHNHQHRTINSNQRRPPFHT